MNFFKRNAPVLVIGLVTVFIFIGIIVAGQTNPPTAPVLKEVLEKDLIATYSVIKGDPKAPVTLTEFSDFGCPACAAFQPIVDSVFLQCNNKLRVVFRHFPLPQHKNSTQASEAAQIAAEYNKFWEYGELLFKNQDKFERTDLIGYAEKLGLDTERFATALDKGIYTSLVQEDIAAGKKLNVEFTPTFFLNNKLMVYKDFNEFETKIQDECKNAIAANDITQESTQTTPSIVPTTEPVIVKEQPSPTVSTADIDKKYGIVNIAITDNGFDPGKSYIHTGQLMRWTNKTTEAKVLMDLYGKYPELKDPVTIEPGKTYELRLYKSGYWMFKETNTGKIGTVSVMD